MIEAVLEDAGAGLDPDTVVGMDSRFADDLELESIDLVALAERLEERYGDRVNFAEFLADLDLDEIIALTVGRLVDHVAGRLAAATVEG
ncbi:acyl carrier protein [Streptomyces radicis]|uniref:Acyl carrier protein n=1 Tax=Streptomyces radicis TaxID=1750517 RepID=A0A3A9WG90_9ACTN|nr:phosphopantetheine-binding protein [Streptomyces radicis]RKN08434.1 acyl carrier protein [Streptomyces radicis]RKN21656.1 acyl carrier protein [Streptomyces radicis]